MTEEEEVRAIARGLTPKELEIVTSTAPDARRRYAAVSAMARVSLFRKGLIEHSRVEGSEPYFQFTADGIAVRQMLSGEG